jgi:hypothetical protein
MSSVVRSVLGAALLLAGATAAMAQSATAPVANQTVQTSASAPTATVAPNSVPVVQPAKPRPVVADHSDTYGGNDPNSLAGARAFWSGANPY